MTFPRLAELGIHWAEVRHPNGTETPTGRVFGDYNEANCNMRGVGLMRLDQFVDWVRLANNPPTFDIEIAHAGPEDEN